MQKCSTKALYREVDFTLRVEFRSMSFMLFFFTLQGLVQFYKNSDRLSLLNIDQRQRMYSFNDVDNKTKWCFFLITVLFLSTDGEMKRIGTYDMKRKVIVVDKSQTAQWEGTAQMSSRLWFRFLLKKKNSWANVNNTIFFYKTKSVVKNFLKLLNWANNYATKSLWLRIIEIISQENWMRIAFFAYLC